MCISAHGSQRESQKTWNGEENASGGGKEEREREKGMEGVCSGEQRGGTLFFFLAPE